MTRLGERTPIAERLDRFTNKSAGPEGCWPWTGGNTKKDRTGYGIIIIERRARTAHAVAYEQLHGPVPRGIYVCHHCDNPPCVNPAHLFVGAPKANVEDMLKKGRARGGARVPLKGAQINTAKLTDESVLQMREARAEGLTYSELAERFGVAYSTVERVCCNRDWKHLAGIDQQRARSAAHARRRDASQHSNTRLTIEDVRQIRADPHLPLRTLAERFGVSPSTIANVRNGKTWVEVV